MVVFVLFFMYIFLSLTRYLGVCGWLRVCVDVILQGLPREHIKNDPGNGKIKLVVIICRLGDLDKIANLKSTSGVDVMLTVFCV